jgi:hypothetical protein
MAYVAEAPNLTCCPGASDSTLRASELLLTLKMGARRVPQAIPHDVKPGIGVRLTATLELRASKLVSPRPGHCPLLLDCQVWQSASGSLDLEADPRTWFAIVAIEFAAFRGAMVKVTADEPVADSTDVAIPWEAVLYDTDAFWSAGNPTAAHGPGRGKVRHKYNLDWTFGGAGYRHAWIHKNGTLFFGRAKESDEGDAGVQNIGTGVVEVTPGDYFEFIARQTPYVPGLAEKVKCECRSFG